VTRAGLVLLNPQEIFLLNSWDCLLRAVKYVLLAAANLQYSFLLVQNDGAHALGYPWDDCPAQAPACLSTLTFGPTPTASPANIVLQNTSDSAHSGDSDGAHNIDDNGSPNIEKNDGANDTHTPIALSLFSSSQMDGAVLIDSVKGIYNYTDTKDVTPVWVVSGRNLVWLKEHPPATLGPK
jgi:hypothetical protein